MVHKTSQNEPPILFTVNLSTFFQVCLILFEVTCNYGEERKMILHFLLEAPVSAGPAAGILGSVCFATGNPSCPQNEFIT